MSSSNNVIVPTIRTPSVQKVECYFYFLDAVADFYKSRWCAENRVRNLVIRMKIRTAIPNKRNWVETAGADPGFGKGGV